MKKILTFFIALIPMLYVHAQEATTRSIYRYDCVVSCDKELNPVHTAVGAGVIVFAEIEGKEYIGITFGEKVGYQGVICSKKQEYLSAKKRMTEYHVLQEFHGHKVPLQIFEVYDLGKSSNVPDYFMVRTCHATTGEVMNVQSFHVISRVK